MAKRLSPELEQRVVELYSAGVARSEIAAQTEINCDTVNKVVRRNGLPSRRGRRTAEQIQRVVELYKDGIPNAEIAAKTGIPYGSISGVVKRSKLSFRLPRLTQEQVRRVNELYEAGVPHIEIAAQLEIGLSTIRKVARRHGLSPRPRRYARHVIRGGYVMVSLDDDDSFAEMANKRSASSRLQCLEHRLVMAKHIHRPLTDDETVHHINGNRADNRIENLQLRRGGHGAGVVLCCADCQSNNIVERSLA